MMTNALQSLQKGSDDVYFLAISIIEDSNHYACVIDKTEWRRDWQVDFPVMVIITGVKLILQANG